jgi:hypothetical protein
MFTKWKSDQSNPGPRGVFSNPLVYTSTALVLAIIYMGVTFLSRWEDSRKQDDMLAQKQAQKRADGQREFDLLGGNHFDILNFYATPPLIKRGETAQLCYGVSNAKAVRLDPPAGNVWPSEARCIQIEPTKTTIYALTAVDAGGNTKTATVTLQVR